MGLTSSGGNSSGASAQTAGGPSGIDCGEEGVQEAKAAEQPVHVSAGFAASSAVPQVRQRCLPQ